MLDLTPCLALLGDGDAVTPWFDPNTFGAYYGAIMGGGGGTLGGVLGALSGWLAPQGKCRGLVVGGFYLMLSIGIANLLFGLFALVSGQPYGIWYGGVLCGGILTTLPLFLMPVVKRRYAEAEQRRMEAADLKSS